MVRVDFDELDERHQASEFDWVGVVLPDSLDALLGEPIWDRSPNQGSLDPSTPMPIRRQLVIEAKPSDDVWDRLEALGYDADGYVE